MLGQRSTTNHKDYVSSTKISVVLLNYNRPHNIPNALKPLVEHPNVDEIIVANGDPKNAYAKSSKESSKVIVIDDTKNNKVFRASRRFLVPTCNTCIIFHDDDMQINNDFITNALFAYDKDPIGIYGTWKSARLVTEIGPYDGVPKEFNVVIHPYMTNRIVADSFLQQEKMWEWLTKHGGNGEDILFSLNLKHVFDKYPKVVHGSWKSLDGSNGYSSGKNFPQERIDLCIFFAPYLTFPRSDIYLIRNKCQTTISIFVLLCVSILIFFGFVILLIVFLRKNK